MSAGSHPLRARGRAASAAALLAAGLAAAGCEGPRAEDRDSDQESVRSERARAARAWRARQDYRRRWHEQYRRDIAQATGARTAPAPPPRACDPWTEFRTRAASVHHLGVFSDAVQLALRPIAAGAVELDGRPHQRFAFALRMHPAEEPDLGRPASGDALELSLRWVPLCPKGPVVMRTETLRLRLARRPPLRRAGRHPGLRLRLPGPAREPLVPGEPVELLLDPTRPSLLGPGPRPAPRPSAPSIGAPEPDVGLWEILDAQLAGRPRSRRLDLDTSAFGDRLRQVSLVEVPCPAPGGSCGFLTRTDGYRDTALELGTLLRQAAPVTRPREVRQLFALLRALKYPRCSSGEARQAAPHHPCLARGRPAVSEPCLWWRALNGHRTPLHVAAATSALLATQVLSCPGPKHRILRVEAEFARNGDLRLRETDLAARADALEAALQKMTR